MRWSPPEQNAHPPSLGEGPLPVSSTQPTSEDIRAWSSAVYSSSTVPGRKALRTSGRLKATRTVPESKARWYVMSVKENPSTTRHRASSKISETMATIVADAGTGGRAWEPAELDRFKQCDCYARACKFSRLLRRQAHEAVGVGLGVGVEAHDVALVVDAVDGGGAGPRV